MSRCQVVSKDAGGNRRAQIFVGGGYDADVDANRPGAAQTAKLALLKHAKHFCLYGERQLRYLVKEDRASVRDFQQPFFYAHRSGESAFLMTEELALQKTVAQGGAVDCDKRFVGTVAVA